MHQADDELLPARKMRARYSTTDRTILRWEREGVLPPPIKIRGRKYWARSDLERLEREGMGRKEQTA
jgi:DNA-binding transcriptional MerR regulator